MTTPATYTCAITATAEDLALLADALAEGAERRRRTAVAAAGELDTERAAGVTADQLAAGALAVVDVLAEASTLTRIAEQLAAAAAPATPAELLEPPLDAPANGRHVPTLAELAGAHNASLVNGGQVWTAPGVLDDDDEDLDAEAAVLAEMQP